MTHTKLYNHLIDCRVVPVIAISDAAKAARLADTLMEGKLPVAEVTFRTSAAAAAITAMRLQHDKLLVGAGTLLNPEDVKRAVDAGAQFGVAPGFQRSVVEEALKLGLPFCPGVMTPSEVEQGISMGLGLLKFFPAEAAGGVDLLKNIIAPYRHTGIRFMPTGGISPSLTLAYLSIAEVLAVGGSWVATTDDIQQENWDRIADNCRLVSKIERK